MTLRVAALALLAYALRLRPVMLARDLGEDMPGLPPTPDDERLPRWVRVFAIIATVLVLIFVIVHLAGGGFGNHMQ